MLMGGYFAAAVIFYSYLPMFLKDFGYSELEIGIVMMWALLSGLVCQLVLGYVADRFNCFKQIIISAFVVMTASLPLLFLFSGAPAFVTAFAIIVLGPVGIPVGMMDSWVAKLGDVDYGKARSAGSIAYAIFSIMLGQAFAALGNHVAVYVMAGIFIIVMCILMGLRNPTITETAPKITVTESIRYLKGNRSFLFMLVGSALLGITFASTSTYFPILIVELGGAQAELGIALFIMATVEFVVMRFVTKLSKRFGSVMLLVVGYLGFFVKSVAFSLSAQVWHIYLFCLLQCVSFALVIPGVVLYLSERVDKKYLAAALLVNLSVGTVFEMIGNPVCGLISELVNVHTMIFIASIPALIAAIIFIFAPKKLPEQPAVNG